MNYNKLIIAANLGKEPELRYTPNGKAVCNISLPMETGYGENKQTLWIRCTAWDKQAETINQYLKKGDGIIVEGQLKPVNLYEKDGETRASLEMTIQSFRFGDKKQDSTVSEEFSEEFDF
jgi:single-strand DNA-binding protein